MIIWHYWFAFCLIQTGPFGKAEPSNLLALVALIRLKYIPLAKWLCLPDILLFINQYSQATAQYLPKIFLYMKFSVKLHNEPGENTLTHSVQLVRYPLTPPRFHCADHHQYLCSLILWTPCWPKQSVNIWWGTHFPLLLGIWIIDAIVKLYLRFIVRHSVIFSVIWIIQVPIQVNLIFGVWNTFRCTILMTFSRMAVDSFESVDIQFLCSSAREVLCRHSWWHR